MHSDLVGVQAHRESHLGLLRDFDLDGGRAVDAIVVPAGRSTDHLATAAELAYRTNSLLVVLCSRDAAASRVAEVMTPGVEPRWHAVDVPAGFGHPLLLFRHPEPGRPERGGRASLSTKRNIGLLLGRMLGWQTLLFLDDDIRDIDDTDVLFAAGGLGPTSAVGLEVADWPDNSVVCHANRLGGGAQEVFVGGSALLVDGRADDLGFFPTIYNEDWLFLVDALLARRVCRSGTVRQLRYDPFVDPVRGRVEEFGDVIAEGLIEHLHEPGADVYRSRFWRDFLLRRRAFIADTAARLAAQPHHPTRRAALRALRAAEQRRAEIDPASCARFVRDWRADLATWRSRLARIEHAEGLPAALARLGLGPGTAGGAGGRGTEVCAPSRAAACCGR